MKRLGRFFNFRGNADKGVMSHFYKPGYRIIDNPSREIKVIIDAGANIGDETVRFRHFHPSAKIIAIEAERNNFEYLNKNMRGDILTVCLHKGLWPVSSRLKIIASEHNEGFRVSEVGDDETDYDIQSISIDDILKENFIESIDILKLDIEGAEFEIFTRNFELWMPLVGAFIFECSDHERSGTVAALFRNIDKYYFDCFIQGENLVLIRRDTGWKIQETKFY